MCLLNPSGIVIGFNEINDFIKYRNNITHGGQSVMDMTIATTALFAEGETVIRNIYNWRVKETDRLSAMATELRKIGAEVEEGEDFIRIQPLALAQFQVAEIATYNDHRMAMCFSLIALSNTPVTILDPKCTAKTFPTYFSEFEKLSIRA